MRRKEIVNSFTERLGNIRIRLHPMRKEAQVILTDKAMDNYGDTTPTETERVFKECILRKVSDIPYVSMDVGVLLTDMEELPYQLILTVTGLPRALNFDDMVKVGGTTYTVSKVFPINRAIDTMIECYVYPERTIKEKLEILGVEMITKESDTTGYFIKFNGYPIQMRIDTDDWRPIQLFVEELPSDFELTIRDATGSEVAKHIVL